MRSRPSSLVSRLFHFNFSLWAPPVALLAFLLIPQSESAKRATANFQKAFAPVAAMLASPIQSGQRVAAHLNQWLFAVGENRTLRERINRLTAENSRIQALQTENNRLAALLNLNVPKSVFRTTALVVADTSGIFARSVLVSVGSDDGVKKWDAVVASGGILGKVVSTSAGSSRVLLITDTNSGVPVMSADGGFRAVMRGDNSPFPILDFVEPFDATLAPGTALVTSGHGGHFAPGMKVGKLMENHRVKPRTIPEPWVSIMRYKRN